MPFCYVGPISGTPTIPGMNPPCGTSPDSGLQTPADGVDSGSGSGSAGLPSGGGGKKPIVQAYVGDTVTLASTVALQDGTPITADNSIVTFYLKDERFLTELIWEADWHTGNIELINEATAPGLIKITIPSDITSQLRRGSYIFSMAVTDTLGRNRYTPVIGTILMEYAPTSPHQDIPYNSEEDCEQSSGQVPILN